MPNPTNSKWYYTSGEQGDCVVSTRVRLARNIKGIPFPARMTPSQKKELCDSVREAVLGGSMAEQFDFIEMSSLTDTAAAAMVERHLISPQFAERREGQALIIARDESVSIMLCEEDHIRIQVMAAGLDLKSCLDTAQKLDRLLDERLSIAFDERLGYLTACPTNLGTGMRASVMLHLPALSFAGGIPSVADAVSKIGLTLRGSYGEGSRGDGAIWQLSNQITLGISEEAAADNLISIATQIIEKERRAVASADADFLEDRAFRALGTLRYARSVSRAEFLELISYLRMGVAAGVLDGVGYDLINRLLVDTGRACLAESKEGALSDAAVRDRLRAELIREALA